MTEAGGKQTLTGFRVGVPAKKYGLNVMPSSKKVASGFSVDDDDDDVNAALKREADKKKRLSKTAAEWQQAVAEDPTVFDYDGVYDSMKGAEADKAEQRAAQHKAQARQPRYLDAIMERARQRKIEQDIIYDRNLQKERQQETAEFGDKEMFVTAAYKRKMQADKEWLALQAVRDAEDERNDVTKRDSLVGFYSSLLDRSNVSVGGAPAPPLPPTPLATPPPTTATAGSASGRQDAETSTAARAGTQRGQTQQPLAAVKRSLSPRPASAPAAAAAAAGSSAPAAAAAAAAATAPRQETATAAAPSPTGTSPAVAAAAPPATKIGAEESGSSSAVAAKLARRHDEAAISDAKARYLARKQAQAAAASLPASTT